MVLSLSLSKPLIGQVTRVEFGTVALDRLTMQSLLLDTTLRAITLPSETHGVPDGAKVDTCEFHLLTLSHVFLRSILLKLLNLVKF